MGDSKQGSELGSNKYCRLDAETVVSDGSSGIQSVFGGSVWTQLEQDRYSQKLGLVWGYWDGDTRK